MSLDLETLNTKIREHVLTHVGPLANMYHQPIPVALSLGGVPLEVLHVAPSEAHPYHTLVTMGMSQKALSVPKEAEFLRHVELVISLAPFWEPPAEPVLSAEPSRTTWPIELLLDIAQRPHVNETFLPIGVLIANRSERGLEPYAKDAPFYGSIIWLPGEFGEDFLSLPFDSDTSILFLSVICMKKRETERLAQMELEQVFAAMNNREFSDVVDPARELLVLKDTGRTY